MIAKVFSGVVNRMTSGYLLRDVLNKVNGMLREMRDAAGENGEFYTPRPVVRFIVEMVDPRLRETVLDPACGTGGFLVEAYRHLEKQCRTVGDRFMLQNNTLFGGEPKPLPYLLCQMNLLLHGLEAPEISADNSLALKITELGDEDRVDVILTNPPFGGEEEAGIRNNFPANLQTSETALLFVQLIMRRLRRPGPNAKSGRAGMVVPNGTLSGGGVCARHSPVGPVPAAGVASAKYAGLLLVVARPLWSDPRPDLPACALGDLRRASSSRNAAVALRSWPQRAPLRLALLLLPLSRPEQSWRRISTGGQDRLPPRGQRWIRQPHGRLTGTGTP